MKIIYLEEKEVKMGDKVSLNGAIVTVTQQLIDDLPNLFKVEEEQEAQIVPEYVECIKNTGINDSIVKAGEIVESWYSDEHIFPYRFKTKISDNGYATFKDFYNHFKPSTKEAWLLQEAKRRYPKGTVFVPLNRDKMIGSPKQVKVADEDHRLSTPSLEIIADCIKWFGSVYKDGQWAEIVKPLFTTEDGGEIFKGDLFWYVTKRGLNLWTKTCDSSAGGWAVNADKIGDKYFSTREAAEEYIAKHREKTLEDYENKALSKKSISGYNVYGWLKENDPKLYWSKVLQLIADDLNEGEIKRRYTIVFSSNYRVQDWVFTTLDSVIFSSHEAAKKAIKIMGNKLDYIYKQ